MTWLLSVAVLAADLFSKRYAADVLVKSPYVVIDGVLEFTYVENRGAAWGIFKGARIPFIVLTLIFLAVLAYMVVKFKKDLNPLSRTIAALLAAGALGNLIDRMLYGYVRDMVYFSLTDFPVFNIADSAIVAGAILLIIQTLFCRDGIFEMLERHFSKKKEKQ